MVWVSNSKRHKIFTLSFVILATIFLFLIGILFSSISLKISFNIFRSMGIIHDQLFLYASFFAISLVFSTLALFVIYIFLEFDNVPLDFKMNEAELFFFVKSYFSKLAKKITLLIVDVFVTFTCMFLWIYVVKSNGIELLINKADSIKAFLIFSLPIFLIAFAVSNVIRRVLKRLLKTI